MKTVTIRVPYGKGIRTEGYMECCTMAAHPFTHYEKCLWFPKTFFRCESLIGAKQDVARYARIIRFMDATGLIPSKAWPFRRPYDGFTMPDAPPGMDHSLSWRPGRYLKKELMVTTEPYHINRAELEAWCAAHGWRMAVFPDIGMWYPPNTSLVLLTRADNPHFDGVVQSIDERFDGAVAAC
ncbi:MAG: hypothetical protein PHE55_22870 [Methylococcaceae bacterium]|nr:hypothetical protein [Methylococcaceae bacterium]